MSEAGAIVAELIESGEWVGGEGLADPATAKSVRVRGGVPAVTDGPFAEAKEQVVGWLPPGGTPPRIRCSPGPGNG